MDFQFKISGIDDVCAALDATPALIVKVGFARAHAAAAVPVVESLVAHTPRHTGDLVEHVMTDIEIDAEGKGGISRIGFGKAGWKARLVETGHRMVSHEPFKEESGYVVAQPFMGPAAAESAEPAIDAFAESLSESLRGDVLTRAS